MIVIMLMSLMGLKTLLNIPLITRFKQTITQFIPGWNAPADTECSSNDRFQYKMDTAKPERPTAIHEHEHQDLYSEGTSGTFKGRQLLSQPHITPYKELQSDNPTSLEKFSDDTLCCACMCKPYVCLVDTTSAIKKV